MAIVLNKNTYPRGKFRIECKGFAERILAQEAYEKLEKKIAKQKVVLVDKEKQ